MTRNQNFLILVLLISTVYTAVLTVSYNWRAVEVAKVEAGR